MLSRSDPQLLVLLAIRLHSLASTESIASGSDLDRDEVAGRLADAGRLGLVRHRDGPRFAGWNLTAEGRKEGERLLGDEIDRLGLRDTVQSAYRDFCAQNPDLLGICSSWQLDSGEPDDAVAGRRLGLVDELAALHERSRHVWRDLAGALERFASYDRRFEHALSRVRAGHGDWVARPTIDSYHTIWFELHEHLLATLGLERSGDAAGGGAP